jgi:hypothetical protein
MHSDRRHGSQSTGPSRSRMRLRLKSCVWVVRMAHGDQGIRTVPRPERHRPHRSQLSQAQWRTSPGLRPYLAVGTTTLGR